MKQIVVDKLNIKYHNNNIIQILCLYNNEEIKEEVLHDWIIDKLNRATSSGEAMTAATTRTTRPAVRAECQKALDEMNKADNNCPILLNKLAFNVFLTTQKNKKGKYHSKAGYGQIWSSLKHLYRMKNAAGNNWIKIEESISIH